MRERKCDITGTRKNTKCMQVSKSNRHTHKVQEVNLQSRKLWWEEGNKFVHLRVTTRTLKTIKKKGLDTLAKEYGVNLNRFSISSGSAPVPASK
jgi:large subunit ribosomal protein L28